MSRLVKSALALFFCLSCSFPSPSHAQEVHVVSAPGNNQWTVSFSRKSDPVTFELDTFCKTKAEALQEAEKLKTWSNSMPAGSSWRLAVILIEGEDSRAIAPAPGDFIPTVRDAVQHLDQRFDDLLKETGETLKKVLKEKKQDLDSALKRVTEFRTYLMKNVNKLNDDNFKEMNGFVASYNKKLVTYQSDSGGQAFNVYKFVNPVNRDTFAKVSRWQSVRANQARLEQAARNLQEEQSQIGFERELLLAEGKQLQADEGELQTKTKERPADPPARRQRYAVYYTESDLTYRGRFEVYGSLEEAGKVARDYNANNRRGGYASAPSPVEDNPDGATTPREPAPSPDPALAQRAAELRQRRNEYERRLKKYRDSLLAAYDAKLAQHEADIQAHSKDELSYIQQAVDAP